MRIEKAERERREREERERKEREEREKREREAEEARLLEIKLEDERKKVLHIYIYLYMFVVEGFVALGRGGIRFEWVEGGCGGRRFYHVMVMIFSPVGYLSAV